jgi:hypothetical protein
MSEFAQRFLNEDWENLPQAPRVYVGAFGKHPAWNDHMDDVGLLTSSLVMLRRSLMAPASHRRLKVRLGIGRGGQARCPRSITPWFGAGEDL